MSVFYNKQIPLATTFFRKQKRKAIHPLSKLRGFLALNSVTTEHIIQLANRLLAKANLSDSVLFSIENSKSDFGAICYDSNEKIIYYCPKPSVFEFQQLSNSFPKQVPNTSESFSEIQKISIAHEIGHALQPNLDLRTNVLLSMEHHEFLVKLNSHEELLKHIDTFRTMLVSIESEAWDFAWNLIADETEKDLFELVENFSLSTYLHGDILNGEEEFRSCYDSLNADKDVDILDFSNDSEGEKIHLKIILDKKPYLATCLRNDKFEWVSNSFYQYDEKKCSWTILPTEFNTSVFDFALEVLSAHLKEA